MNTGTAATPAHERHRRVLGRSGRPCDWTLGYGRPVGSRGEGGAGAVGWPCPTPPQSDCPRAVPQRWYRPQHRPPCGGAVKAPAPPPLRRCSQGPSTAPPAAVQSRPQHRHSGGGGGAAQRRAGPQGGASPLQVPDLQGPICRGTADQRYRGPPHGGTGVCVQATGLRERGKDTSRSTGRSGRQNAATRRNMRRGERVTVQGPVKEQQPDGMSHGGGGGGGAHGTAPAVAISDGGGGPAEGAAPPPPHDLS